MVSRVKIGREEIVGWSFFYLRRRERLSPSSSELFDIRQGQEEQGKK
jgi:hypothetical protein